jgi:glycosyltransferase involved in cell wall biosynthesis
MLSNARIAVVVPAFDEERWIAETVRAMPAFVDLVVVVDDASRDRTSALAEGAGGERTVVLRHAINRGVGAALATGYEYAAARADVVAVMAGDGQMDPRDLEAVVSPVVRGEADYVKGERQSHPEVLRRMPLHRLAASAALGYLTSKAAGIAPLRDSQCGYTAIAADAIRRIDLGALWPGYGYPNDLIGALARARLRIAEVPVRPVYRGEKSGLRPRHLAVIGFLVARVALRRLIASGTHPSPRGDRPRPRAERRSPAPPRANPRAAPDARPGAPL